jgi:Mn-dependent DtxR family transcriptional regulator
MILDMALPYRTDWREMISVLDYCKGKGADRSALEARFGGGESLRETLNALEQLGLIERGETGDVRLSRQGDRLAYAPDPAQLRARLIEALLAYRPYHVPLERAAAERQSVLDGPAVEHIWQVDMRLGQPRNRVEEARTLFFRLCDEAGLGSYRRGVRGQTTRLDLPPDAHTRLREALALRDAAQPPLSTHPSPDPLDAADGTQATPDNAPPVSRGIAQSSAAGHATRVIPFPTADAAVPSIAIQVDMSTWELDKIEAFLRMIGYLPRSES